MATEKSIIEIDVLDDKFKAFAEIFEKFQQTLDDMPNKWLDVNKAITASNEKAKKAQKELERAQKQLNKDLRDGEQLVKKIAKFSFKIAKNFASATLSIAKWVTLGALGGGFGLGALAASTSDYRRRAQGLGVNTGDLRSAEVNFGKYFDPNGVLASVAHLQSDLSERGLLGRLGGNTSSTPAEMLPTIIRSAIEQFNRGGKIEQYANALGLTKVFDIDTLRALSSLKKEELEQTIKQYQEDRDKLANTDEENKKSQAFWTSLEEAKKKLESELIKPLSELSEPLGDLTTAFTNALTAFLRSKELKTAIQDFTDWVGSEDAKNKLNAFFHAVEWAGKGLLKIAHLLGAEEPKTVAEGTALAREQIGLYTKDYGTPEQQKEALANAAAAAAVDKVVSDAYAQGRKNELHNFGFNRGSASDETLLRQTEQLNGLPPGILSQLRRAESSGNNNAVSSKGAKGPFQFMSKTAKEFNLDDPFDFKDSAAAAAKKLRGLIMHYMGNLEYALKAYNWGEGNMDAYLKTGRGAKGQPMPAETANYANKFMITVTNAAGTDLNTSTNAMR